MQMEAARNRKGLMKLMLRMPALRGQLQLLSVRNEDVFNLCGAFDDASVTLERLRKSGEDQDVILEYENICAEIEREIIEICIDS